MAYLANPSPKLKIDIWEGPSKDACMEIHLMECRLLWFFFLSPSSKLFPQPCCGCHSNPAVWRSWWQRGGEVRFISEMGFGAATVLLAFLRVLRKAWIRLFKTGLTDDICLYGHIFTCHGWTERLMKGIAFILLKARIEVDWSRDSRIKAVSDSCFISEVVIAPRFIVVETDVIVHLPSATIPLTVSVLCICSCYTFHYNTSHSQKKFSPSKENYHVQWLLYLLTTLYFKYIHTYTHMHTSMHTYILYIPTHTYI